MPKLGIGQARKTSGDAASLTSYGEGGFYDAIAVKSGTVAKRYLSLDQAMVMGSLGNVYGRDAVRRYFAIGDRKDLSYEEKLEEFKFGSDREMLDLLRD